MDLIKENLSLLIKVFVGAIVLTLSAQSYSGGDWEKTFCDSFLNDKIVKSPNPDELTGAATTCDRYFYKQYEDQKISQKKYEDLTQDLNFVLANKLDQINQYNTEFLSHVRTAKQDCDDDIVTSQTADLNELNREINKLQVEDLSGGFKGAKPDINDHYSAVGQLFAPKKKFTLHKDGKLIEYYRTVRCNITYVEYPNGLKGFETASHCLHEKGKVRGGRSYSDFTITLGNDTARPTKKLTINSSQVSCGTFNPYGHEYKHYGYDSCLIQVNESLPSSFKPLKRRFLSAEEYNSYTKKGYKFTLAGFHPLQPNKEIKGRDGKFYNARTTRNYQICAIFPTPYQKGSSPLKQLFHKCDTKVKSSGAPIIFYDSKTKENYVVAIHGGPDEDYPNENVNYAVNVLPEEFISNQELVSN